jgi:hypothetical protein
LAVLYFVYVFFLSTRGFTQKLFPPPLLGGRYYLRTPWVNRPAFLALVGLIPWAVDLGPRASRFAPDFGLAAVVLGVVLEIRLLRRQLDSTLTRSQRMDLGRGSASTAGLAVFFLLGYFVKL